MKVTRIERLLVPTNAIIDGALGFTVSSNYRLFFDDGSYHDQTYITANDIRQASRLDNVFKFTKR